MSFVLSKISKRCKRHRDEQKKSISNFLIGRRKGTAKWHFSLKEHDVLERVSNSNFNYGEFAAIRILLLKSMRLVFRYEEDAQFVEQVHGEADNGEGDDIGGGGDDGSNDQNCHDGVAAILLHVCPMEDAQSSEQP